MIAGDMTSGGILGQLVSFAVPLMLGSLLQQLYNAFDAMVVGNYVSKEALAAVGASGPLINMIIAFAVGLFGGASSLIGRFFGGRDYKGLQTALHTTFVLSLIMAVILTFVGIGSAEWILTAMGMPDDIIPSATSYLRIYFIGLAALFVYNAGATMLTALGDSRRPLYFLMMSTVLNIVGDLFFVLVLDMGIEGVAWSTVIAEIVSAVMVVGVFMRAQGPSRLWPKKLRIDPGMLKNIVGIGLPGGIQGTIVSFSNVLVQAYINGLGSVAVAGFSAAQKLDGFVGLPVQTMSLACATFVAQNLGARQVARARKGVRHSLLIGAVASFVIAMTAVFFAKQALRIFTPEAAVLDAGAQFMRVMTPYNWILVFAIIIPGALRGAGSVKFSTAASVISFVFVRQVYLFIVTKVNYTIAAVGLGYPITWALAGIAITIFYMKSDWSRFEPEKEAKPDEANAVPAISANAVSKEQSGQEIDAYSDKSANAEEAKDLDTHESPDSHESPDTQEDPIESDDLRSCPGQPDFDEEHEESLVGAVQESPESQG
ncbi:MAG: MATE family efflux transporter [Clostridiales bacterium]|jgi:putative MATE family efflux protein|nr:MATE family efflux transporter [Clostridiales bacterium]